MNIVNCFSTSFLEPQPRPTLIGLKKKKSALLVVHVRVEMVVLLLPLLVKVSDLDLGGDDSHGECHDQGPGLDERVGVPGGSVAAGDPGVAPGLVSRPWVFEAPHGQTPLQFLQLGGVVADSALLGLPVRDLDGFRTSTHRWPLYSTLSIVLFPKLIGRVAGEPGQFSASIVS